MKRALFLLSVLLFTGFLIVNFTEYQAYARKHGNSHKHKPAPKPTPKPSRCEEVETQLEECNADLNTCNEDLEECESQPANTFPGDGYSNPDAFGLSGHGPALSYTDNGDGTFTDNNTGFMWEKKVYQGGVHDPNNTYEWTDLGDANNMNPDGTLFTVFLSALNNSCDGDGVDACATDADCAGIGNEVCGLAGYQDWRIPNVKELQSIVDYSVYQPASSVPGLTAWASYWYWSSTTFAATSDLVWGIKSDYGDVTIFTKSDTGYARAVRSP